MIQVVYIENGKTTETPWIPSTSLRSRGRFRNFADRIPRRSPGDASAGDDGKMPGKCWENGHCMDELRSFLGTNMGFVWICDIVTRFPKFSKHIFHTSQSSHIFNISSTCEKLMPPWNPVLLPGVSSRLPPPGHSSGSTSPHGHLTRAHQGSLSHGNGGNGTQLDFREPILDHNFSLPQVSQVSLFFFETKGKVSLPVSLDYDPNTLTTKIHEVLSGLITQTHKAGHHGHRPFLAIVCAATKPVPAVSTRCSFGESSQTRERKL